MRISLSSAPVGTPWGLTFCFVPFLIHITSVVLTRFSLRSRCNGAPDREESVGVAREEEKGSAAEQILFTVLTEAQGTVANSEKTIPFSPGKVLYNTMTSSLVRASACV